MKPVDKIAFGRRLAQRRQLVQLSQGALASRVGMRQQGVASIEAGEVERPGKLRELAKELGTTEQWLLWKEGPENEPLQQPDVTQVPLLSWVNAGPLADPQAQISVQESDRHLFFPDLGAGDFFALEVNGDSMNRVSPPGSIIVVNRADRELVANRCYVFMERGETTYKRWEPDPARLEPWSWNDAHKPQYVKGKRDFSVVGRVRRTVLDL